MSAPSNGTPVSAGGEGVLATMDAAGEQLWRYRRDILARELDEARAAIAELIESNQEAAAAKRVLDQDFKPGSRVNGSDQRVLRHIAAEERLAAAIAALAQETRG